MTYNLFMRRLVKDLGYPESILRLKFDKNFIVRGVVADIELGNVLHFTCLIGSINFT